MEISLEFNEFNSIVSEEEDDFLVIHNSENKLIVWGSNSHGQLGIGNEGRIDIPRILEPFRFSKVAVGKYHVIATTSEEMGNMNLTFAWGSNEYGQLGLGDTKPRSRPTIIRNFACRDVACNDYQNIAVDDIDRFVVWGRIEVGFFSSGREITNAPTPLLVPGAGSARNPKIFAAVNTIAYIDKDKLNIISNDNSLILSESRDYHYFAKEIRVNTSLIPSYLRSSIRVENIKKMSFGEEHGVLLTYDDALITWGRNSRGQLGASTAETDIAHGPILVDIYCTDFICGRYSTIAVRRDGKVYVWGDNSEGQLGVVGQDFYTGPVTTEETFNVDMPIQVKGKYIVASSNNRRYLLWNGDMYKEYPMDDITREQYEYNQILDSVFPRSLRIKSARR